MLSVALALWFSSMQASTWCRCLWWPWRIWNLGGVVALAWDLWSLWCLRTSYCGP